MKKHDPVNSPSHYTVYPVEPITMTRHMSFCLGNVVKYVLRSPFKNGVEDLKKALYYLEEEKYVVTWHPFRGEKESARIAIQEFWYSDWSVNVPHQYIASFDAILRSLFSSFCKEDTQVHLKWLDTVGDEIKSVITKMEEM